MIDPWGCPVCGGGAGRHDEAAHSDWPDDDEEGPYDQGGNFPPGLTRIVNETGAAEAVER